MLPPVKEKRVNLVQLYPYRGYVADKGLPVRRWKHAAAATYKNWLPQFSFEILNRKGQRRLRDKKICRRLINRTGTFDLKHIVDLIQRHIRSSFAYNLCTF